ncbi:DUF72 domain-containing protein [soil metagenome]
MTLYVGTSGWAYREWKPGFYPASMGPSLWLRYLSSQLSACEINATFYTAQPRETFEKWSASTPGSFRFAVKMHRSLTHSRVLTQDERGAFIAEHLRSMTPLGRRLGSLLWQLHPRRKRDDGVLERLLQALPSEPPTALELGHGSWDEPEIDERIAAGGATRCVVDTLGRAPARLPPGPIAYVRLRKDRYGSGERAAWLELLAEEARGRDVYAFTKHKDAPAGDPFAGVGLAQWLAHNGCASPRDGIERPCGPFPEEEAE